MNLMLKSRGLEVIMAPSSRTLKYKTILMKKASNMSFRLPTLHNKMGWPKEKIELSYRWQELRLDEYKTYGRFWVEAVNMACRATNRLYLHKLLKKTPYEHLNSNKPNVSYFRVFGSKCYVLQKGSKVF
jgi:hypothetical protein